MERRFNLIDEPWLPVVDVGRVSLRQVFNDPSYRGLGGNPVEKTALMKLLLAIAQAACTPDNEAQWEALGAVGVAQRSLDYLEQWQDRFFLYGDQPFLQVPAIAAAQKQSYGAVQPEVSTGNTTLLSHVQVARPPNDADKAMLLVVLMAFALGGKKTDNSVVLTPGYQGKSNDRGKPSTGKPGPAVAHMGLLHSLVLADNLRSSIWLNLLTREQISASQLFSAGVGVAPWEVMPQGEGCAAARQLQQSLMGRLIPMSRFCLLQDDGLHYSEGIAHSDYNGGMADPTAAVDYSAKKPRALWCNPEKRPWRELPALLAVFAQQKNRGFQCWQVDVGMQRASIVSPSFAIWSGGLRVSSNAGEQYASGSDDFVESQVCLHSSMLGAVWFAQLQGEMTGLDELAKIVYACVMGYFKAQLVDGKKMAEQATHYYWQMCERDFQTLLDHCGSGSEQSAMRSRLRKGFAKYAHQAFDSQCPQDTARQLDAWAAHRPKLGKYLKQED